MLAGAPRALTTIAAFLLMAVGTPACRRGRGTNDSLARRKATSAAERRRIIAEGVDVRATLWTPAYVRQRPDFGPDHARETWFHPYRDNLSFTVEIRLADRPRIDASAPDPLIAQSAWSFMATHGRGDPQPATDVRLLAIDRFPSGPNHHYRLVFAVHFATHWDGQAERTRLVVRAKAPKHRRNPLGLYFAHHGARLTWRHGT